MFEVDLARGFAYKGEKGWVIKVNPQGLYIEEDSKRVFLTQQNSRVMEEIEVGYEQENR